MWKTIREIIVCLRSEKFQDCVLKYRKSSLVGTGILGLILAMAIYYLTSYLSLKPEILQSSLTILFLGIPTLFAIWLFRTHDIQRQIDKTQENTNNSSFFECARMLTVNNPSSTRLAKHQYVVALEQLAYLRNETEFDRQRIDSLTQNLNLMELDISGARLNNLDLSNATFTATTLDGAEIKGTKLNKTIREARSLEGAVYSQTTSFPKGFDPEREEMILKQD